MTDLPSPKPYKGGWLQDFLIALVFLTRLPIQLNLDFSMKTVGLASRAFPLIGVIVGGISGSIFFAMTAAGLPPLLCAFLALGAQILLTGALHEDAIGDVADGFGGGANRDKKLEIMRDSRVGTYAVVTLIIILGIKASALAALQDPYAAFAVIISAAVCSRGMMSSAMYLMPAARKNGLGASAGRPPLSAALWALGFAAIIPVLILGPYFGSVGVIAALAGASIIGLIAYRQIGGQTGDVLGSVQQLAETSFLIAMAALFA